MIAGVRAHTPHTEGAPTMGEETIALNRKARHEFHIEETFEAGIVLTGTEIKSIRAGKVSLQEAYARIERGEAWLVGAHIAPVRRRQPLQPRGEADPQAAPPQGRDPRAPRDDEVEGPDPRARCGSTSTTGATPSSRSASPAASSSTTAAATSPIATRSATSPARWPTPAEAGSGGEPSGRQPGSAWRTPPAGAAPRSRRRASVRRGARAARTRRPRGSRGRAGAAGLPRSRRRRATPASRSRPSPRPR